MYIPITVIYYTTLSTYLYVVYIVYLVLTQNSNTQWTHCLNKYFITSI